MRLTRLIPTFALVIASVAAGCSKGGTSKSDTALSSDLSLAGQQQAHLDSISALEANAATTRTSSLRSTSEPAPVHHRSTYSSSSSSAPVTTSSSAGEVTVKHTQRDAAIGAGAGAILGAVTSKNKVKGGIIGGVLGGVLGGVVGNNVDKTKKPPTE